MLPPRPGDPIEPAAVSCDCTQPGVAVFPGEHPIESRQLVIATDGTTVRRLRRVGGAIETATLPIDPGRLARVRELARAAITAAPRTREEYSPRSGSGEMVCTVQITQGRQAIRFRGPMPARGPLVAPILEELRPLLFP